MKLKTVLAYGIGLGLALFPIRNPEQPLLHYLYAPTIAYCLFAICIFLFIVKYQEISLGSKWVYIPMGVILLATIVRALFYNDANGLAFVLLGVGLYLLSRGIGNRIFTILIPFSLVLIATVIYQALKYNDIAGGYLMGYNLAVGFITYAAVTNQGKWQWLLMPVSLIGLFFTGSAEALLVVAILGVVILIRRDWGKRLWMPLAIIASIVLIFMMTGYAGAFIP